MSTRRDIDKAIANLIKWAARPEWSEFQATLFEAHIAPVCEKFRIGSDAFAAELSDYNHMLYGVMFEDFATRRLPDGRNLIDDYLQRRAWREAPAGRRYLQQLRDSVLSLYEIVDVSPGRHCDVRDLVRGGEIVRVYEKAGTETLAKWERLAARVLPGDGKQTFSGGMLPFPNEIAQPLLKMLEKARKSAAQEMKKILKKKNLDMPAPGISDNDVLEIAAPAFTQLWAAHALQRLRSPLPAIINRDGECFQWAETRFPFDAKDRDAIVQRLDATDALESDDESTTWQWLTLHRGDTTDNSSRNLLGSIKLDKDRLTLTTNSAERAESGRTMIAQLLDGLVRAPLTSLQTAEQLLARRKETPAVASAEPGDPDLERIRRQYLDEHYRRSLDEPISMLNNKSPRALAKSKSGRERVIEWLKYLESQEQRAAAAEKRVPYNFDWIWRELKL